MSDLFGPHTGKLTVNDLRFKNLLVNQLIISLAYGFIEYAIESQGSVSMKLDEFFYQRPRPNLAIIQELNERFQAQGAEGFDIEKMTWNLHLDGINHVIDSTLRQMLNHICSIIAQFSCDLILLAGKTNESACDQRYYYPKPSCLPR